MKFVSLLSGSSGNATLVSDDKTNLLIDCGASGKALERALLQAGSSINEIDAILITHEHSDHTKGLGVLSRRYAIPIYTTAKTHSSVNNIGNINSELKISISTNNEFEIGTIGVMPFSIHHDAADPIGFSFYIDNKKYSIATDTGYISDELFNSIKGSDAILLESNHDVDMLRCGPYPFHLQQRILSDYGHLSNETAAYTALKLVRNGTKHIMLGHLSDKNNLPEIALLETHRTLSNSGIYVGKDVTLQIAHRSEITVMDM